VKSARSLWPRRIRAQRGSRSRRVPLDDALLTRAVVAFVFAALRYGYPRENLATLFRTAVSAALPPGQPEPVRRPSTPADPPLDDASHILTLWRTRKEYLHKGKPRPLPLRGKCSLEALIRTVNQDLPVAAVTRQLIATKTVAKRKGSYLLLRSWVNTGGTQQEPKHQLRKIAAFLLNDDFNLDPKNSDAKLFSRVADCPTFPKSELPALRHFVTERHEAVLQLIDDYMLMVSDRADPRERRVRVMAGGFLALEDQSEQSKEFKRAFELTRKALKPTARPRAVASS
jgi:hypothetical protein